MLRKLLRAKIHRARVTEADLHYEGSIRLPKSLIRAGDFFANEAVCIWNINTGDRFETYIIEGGEDDGIISINGAAAHKASPDDLIIIAAFTYLNEEVAKTYTPTVIFVNKDNCISEIRPELTPRHL
jgi:aspartate 1-decarboxylase